MRVISGCLICISIVLSGCLKKDMGCPYKLENKIAPSSEEQEILNYLSANSITATKHGSNMYYEVLEPGSGTVPGLCSGIVINYTGTLVNGNKFDSQTGAIFTLGSLIEGWKVGIPLIKKGGRIKLYIPPSLGYGTTNVKDGTGAIIIPANSILIFDITLTNVQ